LKKLRLIKNIRFLKFQWDNKKQGTMKTSAYLVHLVTLRGRLNQLHPNSISEQDIYQKALSRWEILVSSGFSGTNLEQGSLI
jgi:hypothetical protein